MCKKCLCSIVPPNVLSRLAKEGSIASKNTLADLSRLKQKRITSLGMSMQKGSSEKGEANRYVYDCENTWQQRKTLVRKEGGPDVSDSAVNKVYNISGFMRKYLMDLFGHNSLDDEGMDLIFNVHYREEYNNAYWDGDEMTFGDGDGLYLTNFAESIDVIAHELMHGVTQFVANLQYYSQSGALNEHFSDVFGTIIKQRMLQQSPEEADWLIGNDVVGPNFPGTALRSMKAPGTASTYDSQPDHIDNYYTGEEDNQGVHINSGIPNKAFYLATMKLGIEVTEIVWFETLKKLWANANFEDFLEKILEVAETLTDGGKLPSNTVTCIEEAFSKVGLKNQNKLNLDYQIEVSGGIFPTNKTLRGQINDETLIQNIEQKEVKDLINPSQRDGLRYKFNLSTKKGSKQFSIDESNLNDELKKLIDMAKG